MLSTLSVFGISQKESTTFIFGHSLINHEFQVNPTPSQETSVPHWLHFLSEEAGHTFKVSGQYGFLPQHANLPPFAQWGFDFAEGAWESDYEMFSVANFNTIMITPGNFIQWQGPNQNYPSEIISPVGATTSIFNWCNQQEENLNFYIYENWPDMAPFLGSGFPPSESEWNQYNDNLNSEFHDWFLEYHDQVVASLPNSCIKLIPVGTLISQLLSQSPYNQIPITELYEDDAPHGRPSLYFLASMISYMAIYEEQAPSDYVVSPIIHPIIQENYTSINESFWAALNAFNYSNGDSRVFCNQPTSTTTLNLESQNQVLISPNPSVDFITLKSPYESQEVSITNLFGQTILTNIHVKSKSKINISHLPPGIYILTGTSKSKQILYSKKIIKH